MSVAVEKLEKNMAKLTIEVSADEFSKALEDAYVILVSGNETKAYALTQYGTAGDDATKVTVSGWVSPVGLEGKTWDIYLSVDGQVYESGHSIAL